MVICQFFLEGVCKFGDNCRNDHASSNSIGFAGRPTFGQSLNDRYHFTAAKGGNNSISNDDLFRTQMLQTFRKELQDWDVNKVWPFSCFAAEREHKCLPGLDDHSPEELRMEAYNYKETGNFDTYVNGLSSLSNQVMNRRNQLNAMSSEMITKEINSCNIAASATASNSCNIAASTTASNSCNIAASATASNLAIANPFGTPSSNLCSTGFGGTTQPSTGLFGSNVQPTSTTSSSIFGINNQSGLFSGNTTKNTLNNPFLSTTGGGLFKNNAPTSSSLFGSGVGASANPFSSNVSAAPSGGLFSSSAPAAPSGVIFGSASSGASLLPTPYGSSPSVTNPFVGTSNVSATSGGLFSQSKSGGGVFGSNSTAQVITQDNKTDVNPFLSSASNSQKSVEQLQPPPPPSNSTPVYSSKIPPITAVDIEKFKAAKFVVGKIPTCPPPIELC